MIIRKDLKDHQIIIGCTRDSQIHTGAAAFQLMASGLYDKLITRAEARFMVACDVGDAWKQLLNQAAICGIDEHGIPCFVEGGLAELKDKSAAIEDAIKPKKYQNC